MRNLNECGVSCGDDDVMICEDFLSMKGIYDKRTKSPKVPHTKKNIKIVSQTFFPKQMGSKT